MDDFSIPDVDVPDLPEREMVSVEVTESDYELISLPEGYVEPWMRLEDETPAAYKAFLAYRDVGRARTITAAARVLGCSPNTLNKWVGRFSWQKRALAWDTHMDRLYRIKLQEAIKDMAERHAGDVAEALEILSLPFKAIQRKAENDPDFLDNLSEMEIRRLFDFALKAGRTVPSLMSAERLARGMPTEIVQADGEVRHIHEVELRHPDQIAEVLRLLEQNDALPGRQHASPNGEFVEAEVVEIHDDFAPPPPGEPEANRVPPSRQV